MTSEELRHRATELSRIPLATLPTPLADAPRFAEWVGHGVRIYLKRDDLTDIGYGGNKLRKLEFSLAAAKSEGCDVIVHGLAAQSNYCRQTAAAAAKIGMSCHLVLRRDHKAENPPQANRLLDYVFGATVHMVADGGEQQAAKTRLIEKLKAEGHKPYLVGRRDEVFGAVAYALCMAEIQEQLSAAGATADAICVSGRSGTQAGLVLGKRLLGIKANILGFAVAPEESPETSEKANLNCAKIAIDGGKFLGVDERFGAADIQNTDDYSGPRYGEPSALGIETLLALGRTEGLVVGPVYTAKGLSGVVESVRNGTIKPGSTVVFVHTGGTSEVFAYNAEVFDHLNG